jgi:serine protease Do
MSRDRRTAEHAARWALGLSIWIGLAGGFATESIAQDPAVALENTLVELIEQTEPSVVSIAKIRQPSVEAGILGLKPFEKGLFVPSDVSSADPENPDFQPNTYGAGVIVAGSRANERVILTNYHVVQGGPVFKSPESDEKTKLFVRFADRRSCFAFIIAADPRSDLAVLTLDLESAKIDPEDLKPLDWSASTPIRKGQLVVMLGNPYAMAHDGSASASWGMVSNLARRPLPSTEDRVSQSMMHRLGNLIQIDGRLNLGTSGGPLLNLKGEMIGLMTSLAAIEGYEKSAGFAIPLDDLTRRIIKPLLAGHEAEYGVLGVAPATLTPTAFRDLRTGLKQSSAARIVSVTLDSPASRAGIVVGDVILSVEDIPIYTQFDLMRVVGLHPPGSEVAIEIWRSDRGRFVVKAILGKWPIPEDEGIIETTPRFAPWRGISVDYPTGRGKYHHTTDPFRRAVVVTKVARDSAAQRAEIQPGVFITEVNRIPVQTPGEFAEATKSVRGPVELRLYEGGRITIGE